MRGVIAAIVALTGCDKVWLDKRHDAFTIPGIVARYHFESATTIDEDTGMHPGTIVGGTLESTSGAVGSGIRIVDKEFVVVPDSLAFDGIGAIEIYVKPIAIAPTAPPVGFLSRDNQGTSDGHIAFAMVNSRFFVRMQRSFDSQMGEPTGRYLCSNQAPVPGQWMHVGVNLGAPAAELWIDGVLGSRTDTFVAFNGVVVACNPKEARTVSGNDDPWVIGALGVASNPGMTNDVRFHFTGGAIDELVLHEQRQDFSSRARR